MIDLPMNIQVPVSCAVNVVIMNQLRHTESFKEKCTQVPPEELNIHPPVEGQPWPFFNYSWTAYMMYSLIVVPKEIFD